MILGLTGDVDCVQRGCVVEQAKATKLVSRIYDIGFIDHVRNDCCDKCCRMDGIDRCSDK